jgi:hypothetical protein
MQTVRYGFLEAVQPFLCTEIKGDSRNISEKFGTHPKAAIQSFIGIEIEAPAVINFWVCFRKVRTVLARISRAVHHGFQGAVWPAVRIFRTVFLAEIWHEF